jgi:hypothetical protein
VSAADRLADYVLGSLGADEARELDDLLLADAALRDERDAIAETFALLALSVPPVAPSPSARARLLAAVDGPARYAPFVDRLMVMFDLGRARMQELLSLIDVRAAWGPGPVAGVLLIHFDAGPAALAGDAGFVRVAAGVEFPTHRHAGYEHALVLEGSYVEVETGQIVRAGEVARRDDGTSHTFRALEDLTFAVALGEGIEIGGKPLAKKP